MEAPAYAPTPARNQPISQLSTADAAGLLAVSQELSYVRELRGVLDVVRRSARELTGADGVTFVLREGDLVHYVEENAIAPLWKGRRFPAAQCISGWAMIHRTSVVIEDVFADPRIPVAAYEPTFVRSLAMVPVRRDDPVAAIGAYWAARHAATPRELALLEALADTAAIALANAQLWEQLCSAVRARDEFIGIASHELKTPLTPIVLQLGALERSCERGVPPEALRRDVTRLKHHVQRMTKLVEGLLDVSGVAAGELTLHLARVRLAAVVMGAVERVRRELEASGSDLTVRLDEEAAGTWDPRRLGQVVESLLSNAIKYGEGRPIAVEAVIVGGDARIAVRDHGVGISPEAQRRVFERFERAVPPEHFGGFGMGLWLARHIVEAHGGQVRVASSPGEGALFEVTLPLSALDARLEAEAPRAPGEDGAALRAVLDAARAAP
jgi:signal transduction histidine kinase